MAFKNILVPLDGSELAEKALPYARTIARLKDSNIVLFAVSLTIFVERRDRLFSSYLDATARALNDDGIKTTTAMGYGEVSEQIVKYANSNKIDLIVMSTHGYSGAKKLMFGSKTQKVLFGTTIPVFLVKSKSPEVSGEFSRILVPVDGSPFAESTFPYVTELAKKTGSEVLLLHICEPPVVPSYGSAPINPKWKKYRDEMWSEVENLSTNYLTNIVATFKKKGVKTRFMVVRAQTGEVPKNIIKAAKDENIDLIITATQGRSGVAGLVYGSVANKLVESSTLPMLLVRPEMTTPLSPPQTLLDDIWHGYMANKT
jgi:nucleotide-binding universal stress UspA family protein